MENDRIKIKGIIPALATPHGETVIPAVKAILKQMEYAVANASFPMKRYSGGRKTENLRKCSAIHYGLKTEFR